MLVVVCALGSAPSVLAAEGGTIAGKVTSAATGAALAGIEVCAREAGGGSSRQCAPTGVGGEYAVPGLQSGEYQVEFVGAPDYVSQYYDGKASLSEASAVKVTAGEATSEIDAAMQPASMPSVNAGQGPHVAGAHRFPLGLEVAIVGETLSCTSGSWSGSPLPAFTYRWLRDGAPIASATEIGYKVQAADESHSLSCEVTATNIAGSVSATSASLKVPRSGSGLGGLEGGGEEHSTGEPEPTGEQTSVGAGSPTGKPGAQVAVSKAIAARAGAVFVVVHCLATVRCAAVTVQLVVVEHRRNGRRTVVVGSTTVTIEAKRSKTVEVRLSSTGMRIEGRSGRFAARVRIVFAGRIVTTRRVAGRLAAARPRGRMGSRGTRRCPRGGGGGKVSAPEASV